MTSVSRIRFRRILSTQFKAAPYKTGLLAFLVLVLLVLAVRQLSGGPRQAEAMPQPVLVPVRTAPISDVVTVSPRPALPDLPDAPSRDPFRADWLVYSGVPRLNDAIGAERNERLIETAPLLQLELTLTAQGDHGQAYAVINGTTVGVGGAIGKFVVESIFSGVVILVHGENQRMALRMD